MDFIKEWTLNVSITLIVAVVFSLMTPKGSIGRFYKIILSAFILFSFLLPMKDSNLNISFPIFDNEFSQENQLLPYEKMIEEQIENTLAENDFNSCTTKCITTLKGDEIYIDKIQVSIPDTYEKEEIRALIFDTLGLNSEVYYVGE